MIKPRTIILSLTAVTLSACAHSAFTADNVTRQDTGAYALSPAAQDHQDQRIAQLDNEIYHLSAALQANEITEDAFATRMAAIEAERAGLSNQTAQLNTQAPKETLETHSARSTISLL